MHAVYFNEVVFHLSPTIQSRDLTDLDLVEHIEIETGTNGVESGISFVTNNTIR